MKNEVNKAQTVSLETRVELQEPQLYQVYLHNDDFTPMEFVAGVLERFFYMGRQKATEVMLEAHMKGKALCGIYTKDLAETLVSEIIDYARIHEYPLVCSTDAA